MNWTYDARYDTLYIALGDKRNSYGDDSQGDVIIARDCTTDAITGCTVMLFMQKYRAGILGWLEDYLGVSLGEIACQAETKKADDPAVKWDSKEGKPKP